MRAIRGTCVGFRFPCQRKSIPFKKAEFRSHLKICSSIITQNTDENSGEVKTGLLLLKVRLTLVWKCWNMKTATVCMQIIGVISVFLFVFSVAFSLSNDFFSVWIVSFSYLIRVIDRATPFILHTVAYKRIGLLGFLIQTPIDAREENYPNIDKSTNFCLPNWFH